MENVNWYSLIYRRRYLDSENKKKYKDENYGTNQRERRKGQIERRIKGQVDKEKGGHKLWG